jgi:hypothetical protein
MAFDLLMVVDWHWDSDPALLGILGDIEGRVGLLVMLLLGVLILLLLDQLLEIPHAFGVATLAQILKCGIFLLGILSIGSRPSGKFFMFVHLGFEFRLVKIKVRHSQDFFYCRTFVRCHSQNGLDEVDIIVVCIRTCVPKRSQK